MLTLELKRDFFLFIFFRRVCYFWLVILDSATSEIEEYDENDKSDFYSLFWKTINGEWIINWVVDEMRRLKIFSDWLKGN